MGKDKGLIDFKGKKLVEYPLELLSGFCDEILISANNEDYLQFGYPVIPDESTNSGPAGGVAASLKASSNEWNLVLSCDTPFVNEDTIQILISFAGNKLGAVPLHEGKAEPLVALYHKSFGSVLESNIRQGNLKMLSILMNGDINFVNFNPLMKEYPHIFDNFNAPEDLKVIGDQ